MNTENIHKIINRLGACSLIKGNESLGELLGMLSTSQGLEFCQKTDFPSLVAFRGIDKKCAKNKGIYIDAGDISLHNPMRVILVGDTNADIVCDDNAEIKHNVIVMHGANANIVASNWAVVFAERNTGGGIIKITKSDNALVYAK